MQRPFRPRRATVVRALALAGALACVSMTPVPPTADGLIRSGLHDLHDGLYDKAEASFRQAARVVPADPGPQLFIAFDLWWRILDDPADTSRDRPFLDAVEQAVAAGERLLEDSPDDVRVRTAVGTAHILRSQVEGLRRNFFKASQEARRGKKLLQTVHETDSGYADALFGLGAYNYYTNRIPGLARGLLFMPRGDPELGLEQLKTLARSDAYFSTDALLLLAMICGSRDERCYPDSLAHLTQALRRNPGSPLVLGTIAGLKTRLMDYPGAIEGFEAARAAASGPGDERARQHRVLSVYLADALAADWRLAGAAEALRDAGDPAALPTRDRQAFERIEREIAQKRGETPETPVASRVHPSDRLQAALRAHQEGREADAFALLASAAETRPGDPLPHLLAGRFLFLAGKDAGAAKELGLARERAVDPPPWMAGSIELYLGLIESRLGHREEARAHFQTASQVRRFRSVERALMELQEGTPPHARCAP